MPQTAAPWGSPLPRLANQVLLVFAALVEELGLALSEQLGHTQRDLPWWTSYALGLAAQVWSRCQIR